jgi:hypothetical protein
MAVIITGNNTPTAGGITYGDGTTYANTAAGTTGQYLKSNGASAPTWVTLSGGITLATPVASTSGTSVTFTGIPAGTKRITMMFKGVSTDGTGDKLIRIGDSGGLETSGYVSVGASIISGTAANGNATSGFVIYSNSASHAISGSVILSLYDAATFTWAVQGVLCAPGSSTFMTGGIKSLSAELTQISFTAPPDNFDAGEINISYE